MMETMDTVELEQPPMTARDRCDGCSAQARVKVRKADLELIFCKHHFERQEPQLLLGGWAVTEDAREALR